MNLNLRKIIFKLLYSLYYEDYEGLSFFFMFTKKFSKFNYIINKIQYIKRKKNFFFYMYCILYYI